MPISKPLSSNELAFYQKLFWESHVLEKFRQYHGSMFNVTYLPPYDEVGFREYLFDDGPKPIRMHQDVIFVFTGHQYGDQIWVAPVCRGYVIIPPFLLPADRKDIPYYPEERACFPFL